MGWTAQEGEVEVEGGVVQEACGVADGVIRQQPGMLKAPRNLHRH